VDGARVLNDIVREDLACQNWLARQPLFNFLDLSAYWIFLMALDRYLTVARYQRQKNNVRTARIVCRAAANE